MFGHISYFHKTTIATKSEVASQQILNLDQARIFLLNYFPAARETSTTWNTTLPGFCHKLSESILKDIHGLEASSVVIERLWGRWGLGRRGWLWKLSWWSGEGARRWTGRMIEWMGDVSQRSSSCKDIFFASPSYFLGCLWKEDRHGPCNWIAPNHQQMPLPGRNYFQWK